MSQPSRAEPGRLLREARSRRIELGRDGNRSRSPGCRASAGSLAWREHGDRVRSETVVSRDEIRERRRAVDGLSDQ